MNHFLHVIRVCMYLIFNRVNYQGIICDVLGDTIPFAQFKKLERHTWRSVGFSKVVILSLQHY